MRHLAGTNEWQVSRVPFQSDGSSSINEPALIQKDGSVTRIHNKEFESSIGRLESTYANTANEDLSVITGYGFGTKGLVNVVWRGSGNNYTATEVVADKDLAAAKLFHEVTKDPSFSSLDYRAIYGTNLSNGSTLVTSNLEVGAGLDSNLIGRYTVIDAAGKQVTNFLPPITNKNLDATKSKMLPAAPIASTVEGLMFGNATQVKTGTFDVETVRNSNSTIIPTDGYVYKLGSSRASRLIDVIRNLDESALPPLDNFYEPKGERLNVSRVLVSGDKIQLFSSYSPSYGGTGQPVMAYLSKSELDLIVPK